MVFAFLPSFIIIPSTIQTTINFETLDDQEPNPETSQFIPRTIRVAVYDSSNTTMPPYGAGDCKDNLTDTLAALNSAGYQVTQLTTMDISNHELKTASYDVFIMVDNLPLMNNSNYIKEFWLGGGGILSFDSDINFLCYYGILPPESLGNNGSTTLWSYEGGVNEIYQRHPISKHYSVGDTFIPYINWATLNWTALQDTSIASDLVRIATLVGDSNNVTVLGYDPSDGGGRIVQMPWTYGEIPSNMTDLVNDAVDWACPRPKGRILFDMSHKANYGFDPWDTPYVVETGYKDRFSELRNNLVNHSYTVDKLYPSASGNLTMNNLAPYDLLIEALPGINFTAAEVSNVQNWINTGGNFLALGDYLGLPRTGNINYLVSSFLDLSIVGGSGGNSLSILNQTPTTEACTQMTGGTVGIINYTGDAAPIWGSSPTVPVVGYQEYGNGRVILTADINIFDNARIYSTDNLQFAINAANWLTASQAKILLCVNELSSANYYISPVARALNELRLPFALTFNNDYLNLSLYKYSWELVIIDMPSTAPVIDNFIDYIDSGGRLIMSSYVVDNNPSHPLWAKLGFSYSDDETDPVPIYIWESSHRIFTTPIPYGANNFTAISDYSDEGDYLTVYPNATALAGFTNTTETGNASIVLRNDGKTLYNSYIIDEFSGDVDDSTYEDRFELWLNEIAYMIYQSLLVNILNPHTDDIFDATAPSYSITTDGIIIDEIYYTLNDAGHYPITSTSGTINQGAWDALSDGAVSLKVYVEDTAGSSKYAAVSIDKDTQAPIIEILSPTNGQTFNDTAPEFIVNITDPHLDKMWYTVNASLANFTFTTNGTINQAAWEALSEGTVTVTFYANDTLGHESFKQVSINFEIPSSKRKGIPGYDTYLIIGVISVISVLILENRLKRLKLNK